jgi:hypothetical protein
MIYATPFFVIGYAFAAPKRKQEKAGRAYYQQLVQSEPFGKDKFKVSTNPIHYNPVLSSVQSRACAHRVARDLSVEFLGLTVFVTDGSEDKSTPRKIGIKKNGWPRKKTSDEPLEPDEQVFWPTFQKLKIKAVFEAKENRLPDVDPEGVGLPPDGTEKHEECGYLLANMFVFKNEVSYRNGQLQINREWQFKGGIHYEPEMKNLDVAPEPTLAQKPLTFKSDTTHPPTTFDGAKLMERTKLGKSDIAYWGGYVFWLEGSLSVPHNIFFGPLGCVIFGCLACSSWCNRITYRIVIKRDSIHNFFRNIYLSSIWSYVWRSFLTFQIIGIGIAVGSDSSRKELDVIIGTVFATWFFSSLFVPIVPLIIRENLIRDYLGKNNLPLSGAASRSSAKHLFPRKYVIIGCWTGVLLLFFVAIGLAIQGVEREKTSMQVNIQANPRLMDGVLVKTNLQTNPVGVALIEGIGSVRLGEPYNKFRTRPLDQSPVDQIKAKLLNGNFAYPAVYSCSEDPPEGFNEYIITVVPKTAQIAAIAVTATYKPGQGGQELYEKLNSSGLQMFGPAEEELNEAKTDRTIFWQQGSRKYSIDIVQTENFEMVRILCKDYNLLSAAEKTP